MKLTTQDNTIRRSGNFQESTFKIAATAKAFDILSSKLYTNAKLAIVRELSTNAWDAHIEAGTTNRAFDVHLPNNLEPYFSIRDYGTGLSPHAIETIYTTYFASTRNDSNDFTGALGLGSKSPFSYTDQFTVTSYYDGTVYTYSAFKNEHGEPSITLLSQQATIQSNGLEIRLNINRGDEHAFIESARQVYQHFPLKPNITGCRIDFPQKVSLFDGNGYVIAKADYGRSIFVVMGNVAYSVDDHYFTSKFKTVNITINCDIGDCDIAANREELHYNERTIAHIQSKLAIIEKEVLNKIEKILSSASTTLEKYIAAKQFKELITIDLPIDKLEMVTPDYKLIRTRESSEKLFIIWNDHYRYLPIQDNINFIEVNQDKLKQSDKNKIRSWIKQTDKLCYLAYIKDRQKFIETFGEPTIKLENLPAVPIATRSTPTAAGSRDEFHFVKRLTGHTLAIEMWKTVDSIGPKSIAIPRDKYTFSLNKVIRNSNDSYQLQSLAQMMGYATVYGINNTHYDKIRTKFNLPDFEEELRKYLLSKTGHITDYDVYYLCGNDHISKSFSLDFIKVIHGLSDECNHIVNLSKLKDLDPLRMAFAWMGMKLPNMKTDFVEQFYKKYPLLQKINLHYVQKSDTKDMVDYIKIKEK